MDYKDAMEVVRAGGKVRRDNWVPRSVFVTLGESRAPTVYDDKGALYPYRPHPTAEKADNWILYPDPT